MHHPTTGQHRFLFREIEPAHHPHLGPNLPRLLLDAPVRRPDYVLAHLALEPRPHRQPTALLPIFQHVAFHFIIVTLAIVFLIFIMVAIDSASEQQCGLLPIGLLRLLRRLPAQRRDLL